jgi:hypothetical protein
MRRFFALALLCACSKSSSPPPAAKQTGSAAITPPSDAATVAVAKKKTPATPAQLAEYRKHMKAGWAAQKAKKWADATTEFEAASKILDGDQRALSELGWSAMNAGDFKKARAADDEAVRVAIDPKVKAASLYNLGMVFSRTNDLPHAAEAFKQSLALRPNKIVQAELAKLSSRGFDVEIVSTCAEGTPVCQCVVEEANGEEMEDWKDRCKESEDIQPPLPGFHVYDAQTRDGNAVYLTDERDRIITQLAGLDEHMRSTIAVTLDKMEVKTVAGHKILWIEATGTIDSMSMSETSLDDGSESTRVATVCDVGDAKRPTKCLDGLVIAAKTTSEWSEIDPDTGETKGDIKKTSTEVVNDVTLGEDGVVTVKLVKGSVAPYIQQMLGPHVLWQ